MVKELNTATANLFRYAYKIVSVWNPSLEQELDVIKLSIVSGDTYDTSLLKTVLIIEDKRFWEHQGIDTRAIIRAFYRTIVRNRLEGGSTIEQQYIRLITNRTEINMQRKVREWLLAVKLNDLVSKKNILYSYLSKYKFIGNVVGVNNLIQKNHYGKKTLNNDEIALIVTRLKYPFRNKEHPLFLRRLALVNQVMEKNNFSKKPLAFDEDTSLRLRHS